MLTASTPNTSAARGAAGNSASATASDPDAWPLGNVLARMVVCWTHARLNRRMPVPSSARRPSVAHGGRACSHGSVPNATYSAADTSVQNLSADAAAPDQINATKPAGITTKQKS